jgi:hypothetical protein
MSDTSIGPDDLAFLHGKIVCSPEEGMRAINKRRTSFYEIVATGEIESYLDGSRRQIVVASLVAYVQKRIEAARAEREAA